MTTLDEPDEGPDQGPLATYKFPVLNNLGSTANTNHDLDKIAIIDYNQGPARYYSFNNVDHLANNAAGYLLRSGIGQGDRVAIVARNSVEFVAVLFGIYRIGAVAVPLNYKTSRADIEFMIKDSNAKIVFCDDTTQALVDSAIDLQHTPELFADCDRITPINVSDIDEGLLLYTSGSSGFPKGVIISHKNHLWVVDRHRKIDRKWGIDRISIISAPMYHMNGLSTTQGGFASYSTIILLPEFNARRYLELIQEHKVNTLYAVTPMMAMLINEKPLIDNTDLSCVRGVFMASAPLSKKLVGEVKHYFQRAWITQSYGLTEAGPRMFGAHPDKKDKPELSVGYPVPGINVRLVEGILQVKSPSMMTSYNNRPDLMEKSLTEDGYFITNDLFTIDEDGFYYFAGRADDMFKSGGNTVYPSKIEEILESNTEVQSAVVLGIEDDIKGKKPYAFVIRSQESVVTEQQLKDYVLANAAVYMHPRRIWFLDKFPLIGSNKIDKKSLKELALEYLAVDSIVK